MRGASLIQYWDDAGTHRQVGRLALPMIASNLAVPLVSLVDSIVAGHLPHPEQLGAVAVGSSLYTLLVWACGFLRMGATGFTAQALGRNDGDAIRGVLLRSLLLALVLAMLLGAGIRLLRGPLLALMRPSAELEALASTYLEIRLFGLPAALLSYALVGWFLGLHRAGIALCLLLMSNLGNIAFNLWLVLGLGWGVAGLAWASVIGEWSGAVLGAALALATLRRWRGRLSATDLRQWALWRPLLAVNRDIFVRTLALESVFFVLTVFGTRLGDTVVAANSLLLNGLLLTANGLDGLAQAVEALSGRAIGARDKPALYRALTVAGGWSALGALVYALGFVVAGDSFIDLQTDQLEVRTVAHRYLPYLALLPLVAVWSYLLDGLFIGATRAAEMRNAMLLASGAFMGLAWLLRPLGNHGLWLAFLLFMAVRGAVLAAAAVRLDRGDGWFGD